MKHILASALFLAAIFCYESNAHAQKNSSHDELWELRADSIDVTVLPEFRLQRKASREIVPSQTLSGEELERLGTHSVADALRYFSGAQIKDYGGIGGLKTVNIRSMGSQHVGVFYDGIQITNAQNGTVDLGKFSLDNIEMLSLYNGQKSDIFQSAKDFSSSSAVYMVTRKPVFTGGKRNNLMVKASAGSFDLIRSSVLWETRLSDRISTSANAEVMNTSGKYKFRYKKRDWDTTEVRTNADVFYLRGEAALFGKFDDGEWQLKGYYYGSTRGYPGAATLNEIADTLSVLNEDRQIDRNVFVQGSFRHNPVRFYHYKISAKYSNDYMHYWLPVGNTGQDVNTHYWQSELYASLSNLFIINRFWSVNAAGDIQRTKLNARGLQLFNEGFVKPMRYTALAALAASFTSDKVNIQASMLYTHVHDKHRRTPVIGSTDETAPDRQYMGPADDKNVFSPTVIGSYRPWHDTGLTFRAFYKKIFRLPTFNDLYYVNLGSKYLKPEFTTQYNIGAAYGKAFRSGALAAIDASADVYYNEVKDKIIATPTNNQLVWTMVNLGYVEIRGIDIAASARFRFGELSATGRITYTYQKAQDFTDSRKDDAELGLETYYGDQIPYIPWHSGSAIVNLAYRSWDLNYSFVYTGERYMLGANIPVNYILPWYTHDMSLTKSFDFRNFALKAGVEVNNIFNQRYEVVKWYPMPGTNFKVNLTMIF